MKLSELITAAEFKSLLQDLLINVSVRNLITCDSRLCLLSAFVLLTPAFILYSQKIHYSPQ